MKLILTTLSFLILYSTIANGDINAAKFFCKKNKCTHSIKKLKISNFFFKSKNCETKDYRKCFISFGNKKQTVKISWVKHYRILNGPVPSNPICYEGKLVWFSDLDFLNKGEQINHLKFIKKLNYQNKEKMYFNKAVNQTFSYFSDADKSVGIFVNSKNFNGIKKNTLFIFDTEEKQMKILNSFCKTY